MELRKVIYDTGSLISDFEHENFDMDWGFTPEGGYYEEMNNDDIRHVFEEVYQIKEDLKAFLESDVVAGQYDLNMAAYGDDLFLKMVDYARADTGINTMEELCDRLHACMAKLRRHMRESPVMRRLKKQIVRMLKFAKKTMQVSDEGNPEEWKQWWEENDFQPWN